MDDEEAEQLIRELQVRFRAMGEPQIADQDAFVEEDVEGFRRRQRPRERLAEMIEMFERTIMLDDITTYRKSVELIARAADGEFPQVRIVPYAEPGGDVEEAFSFVHLRDLSDLRERLRRVSVAVRSGEIDDFEAEE